MGSDAPGNYMEQLAWYDAQLQQDDYLLGAAIYAAAASPGWETFEILGGVEPFLAQYLSVHPAALTFITGNRTDTIHSTHYYRIITSHRSQ